jgi:hypothetical protein
VSIKNPYQDTPYVVLAGPDEGSFPLTGSCREATDRYTTLMRKQGPSPALRSAWDQLRAPGKRIALDIFLAPAGQETRVMQALAQTRQPLARRAASVAPEFGEELLLWPADSAPPAFEGRQLMLSRSTLYDTPARRLEAVAIDR